MCKLWLFQGDYYFYTVIGETKQEAIDNLVVLIHETSMFPEMNMEKVDVENVEEAEIGFVLA